MESCLALGKLMSRLVELDKTWTCLRGESGLGIGSAFENT